MAKKIYLSPSDQNRNTYKVGNTNEAAQCSAIADLCVVALKRCGFEAKTNKKDDMYDRVRESNEWGADAHIPIHTNAFDGSVAGFRGFYHTANGQGHKLVAAIMKAVAPITPGESDNLSAYPGLYEVRASDAPCAYLELGFHDNATEARYIIDHKKDLAEAICKGVCNYFGVKYVSPAKEEKEPVKESEKATQKLYRVFNAEGKQTGAYSVEANAFNELRKQLKSGGSAKITYGTK